MTRQTILTLTAAVALAAAIPFVHAAAPSAPAAKVSPPTTSPATQPKALTDHINTGLKWLVSHQNPDGGFPQGEESSQMGNALAAIQDKSNVGDTCIAVLALLRSGSTPAAGPYAENIRKGIAYVIAEVDKSDDKSLSVTSVNGTRIQTKLGPNIDTFLAALMLGETRNIIPDAAMHKTVIAALDKVMDKIEKNQSDTGQVAQGGWASSLAQGVAAKAANTAAANGAKVDEKTLQNFERFSADKQLASATPVTGGTGTATGGAVAVAGAARVSAEDAGVPLYANASNLSSMQTAQDRLESRARELKLQIDAPATQPGDQAKLRDELKDIDQRARANGENLKNATGAAAKLMQDDRFIAGFGSNGGEEFLSYLNLGETVYKNGGEDWKKWDEKMTLNLNNFQNQDGSWSGQHCITGRTFCTSAALMVLLIDHESTQIAGQIKRH